MMKNLMFQRGACFYFLMFSWHHQKSLQTEVSSFEIFDGSKNKALFESVKVKLMDVLLSIV